MPDLLDLAVAVGVDNAFVGTITGIRDADTVHVGVVDPLLSTTVVLAVRITGVNARELSEPGGMEARAALAAELPVGTTVTLRAVRPDKYAGRVDAHLTTAAGVDIAAWLVGQGWAAAWNGVGPKPVPPWPRGT